jgi:hypothetical protein
MGVTSMWVYDLYGRERSRAGVGRRVMRWFLAMAVGVSFAVLTMVWVSPVGATVSGEDGRIAFVSDISGADQIYVVNSDGSGLMQITAFGGEGVDTARISSVTWSPDGQELAFSIYDRTSALPPTIWMIDVDGTGLTYITDGGGPSWSPDGRSLAFSLGSVGVVNGLDTSVIATLELETGRQAILTDPGTWVHMNDPSITTWDGDPAWTTDGHEILFSRYIRGSASWSNSSLGVVNVATLAVRGAGTSREDWVGRYVGRIDGAPGGDVALVSRQFSLTGGPLSVAEYNMDLEAIGGIEPPEGFDWVEAVYSPSGERLIVYRQTGNGTGEMWTMRVDGSDAIKVADDGRSPVWEPVNPYPMGSVDPASGEWHLRDATGAVVSFYYGNPEDVPFMGDWDCDGIDTPGLYRQTDGYVYLRNSNSQGIADRSFFFGNPGDVPLSGDFNGDGCDTVSLYRPSEQRFYIVNQLATSDEGLGQADVDYVFGNPGDTPFVGDFDGDGIDTAGLHRASTGLVYYRNTHSQGTADNQFLFGDPGDRFITYDWNSNGADSPAVFRPSNATHYFRFNNTQGPADAQYIWGQPDWQPVTGTFSHN